MQWLSIASSVVYYILLPVIFATTSLLYVLHWLATPFIYIGHGLKELAFWPIRFLAHLEALWYFLGCAVLLGAVLGLLLHSILRAFVVVFDLDKKPIPKSKPPRGHDAASYRAARDAKKQKELEKQQRVAAQARLIASQPLMQEVVREARQKSSMSGLSPLSPGTSRPALLQETILEHTDEEDDDSVF